MCVDEGIHVFLLKLLAWLKRDCRDQPASMDRTSWWWCRSLE